MFFIVESSKGRHGPFADEESARRWATGLGLTGFTILRVIRAA